MVPRTHAGFGDRAFQVAGPRLWNSLPASLRQSDTTVGQFKKLLKTHLFSWDCGALVTVAFTAPCINISTTTTSLLILLLLVTVSLSLSIKFGASTVPSRSIVCPIWRDRNDPVTLRGIANIARIAARLIHRTICAAGIATLRAISSPFVYVRSQLRCAEDTVGAGQSVCVAETVTINRSKKSPKWAYRRATRDSRSGPGGRWLSERWHPVMNDSWGRLLSVTLAWRRSL